MTEELQEEPTSGKADHLKPWQFKPGQSGNPKGRTPGPSLKEWSKTYLMSLTDDQKLEFMTGIDKKTIWEMAEGKPDTKTEMHAQVEVNRLSELSDDELDELIAGGISRESKERESQA